MLPRKFQDIYIYIYQDLGMGTQFKQVWYFFGLCFDYRQTQVSGGHIKGRKVAFRLDQTKLITEVMLD